MFVEDRLTIFLYSDAIIVKNNRGNERLFPRCGITNVKQFVMEMLRTGKLDSLL